MSTTHEGAWGVDVWVHVLFNFALVGDQWSASRPVQGFALIIGLCILLRMYQSNIGITSVRNKVFFSSRFYCALLTLHVSAPFGCHLQVVRKHK
jgi:hypothetical protein